MLSVLLGCAFVSRQFWGFLADRIGGPRTILAGSACQITAMIGFLLTRNEAGLFAVAAWFGLGFSGIIPAYVLAVREFRPARPLMPASTDPHTSPPTAPVSTSVATNAAAKSYGDAERGERRH